MLEGSCHCGNVRWSFDGTPESATACNCTVCRRYGVLWAYDYEDERIRVSGSTSTSAGGRLAFIFMQTAAASLIGARSPLARMATAASPSTCGWRNPARWVPSRSNTSTGSSASMTSAATDAASPTCGSRTEHHLQAERLHQRLVRRGVRQHADALAKELRHEMDMRRRGNGYGVGALYGAG